MGQTVGTTVGMRIRLLGPMEVARLESPVALPRSRKVRALLAYLALAPAPVSRSRLCDLFWDVPNDPRGELRWCLSKLRGVLDDEERPRLQTTIGQTRDLIALDLADCEVDALLVNRIDLASMPTERIAELSEHFRGDFLEGMLLDGAELTTWMTSHRQRYHALHAAVMSELTKRAPVGSDEALRRAESWLKAAPLERRAHEVMIDALVARGQVKDAETHVASAIRSLEHEGMEWGWLREALSSARQQQRAPSSIVTFAPAALTASPPSPPRRGSVVVMPFVAVGANEGGGRAADGLTDDIITRLAKLRVLFVIARGTSYALRDRGIDPRESGRILNVEYVVSGSVRRHADRMTVLVEVVETRDGGIIWTDEMDAVVDETFRVLDSIVDRIVAAVSEEIEREETRRAIAKPPTSLDAWEKYHRGLWHMYKFTGPDNEVAATLFREALKLDPTFARAHSGLSFTHFQNVFLNLTPNREHEMVLAVETAGHALASDDRDPASHWAMGRAQWLRNNQTEAIAELERSVELSPNFALGHYTLGFVLAQSGDPQTAINATDYSRSLSPFDPLQFGMLGARALAHMRRGEREEAAMWAVKAAMRPNAHAHILAIAATNLSLVRRRDEAKELVARIRTKLPRYTVDDFLRAFRFTSDAEKIIRQGARAIGFD